MMRRAGTILTLTAIAMLGLSGCNKAEPPAKVQEDVAKATDSAAQSDAKASDKLANADASANKEVGNAEAKADSKTTDAAGDAVITQAEGDHKVAVAQCESLQEAGGRSVGRGQGQSQTTEEGRGLSSID
jgi:hypothetical protein